MGKHDILVAMGDCLRDRIEPDFRRAGHSRRLASPFFTTLYFPPDFSAV